MPAPPYTYEGASSATDNSSNNNVTGVDWTSGDSVYVFVMTDDQGHTVSALTNANLTFSQLTNSPSTGVNSCKGYVYKAVASSSQTAQTITVTINASGGCLAGVYVVSGNPTNSVARITVSTTKTSSVTRNGTDSVVFGIMGDWGAGVLTAPAPNPLTNGTLRTSGISAGNATFALLDWDSQGAPGATSYGISGSAGTGSMTKLWVELEGTASSGTTYEKVGVAVTGSASSGADVFEASETGTTTTASLSSGADAATLSRTATPTTGTRSSGADVFEGARTGTATTTTRPAGTDASEHPRANTITAGTLASGPSDESTGGGTTYEKTCTAIAGTLPSGGDTHEAARTATTATGSAATGPDTFEASETGSALTGTLARASAQAGFVSKLGTASTASLATGADAYTAVELGTLAISTVASGADVFTAARTSAATAGTKASGASQKISPVTYQKTGTLVLATIAGTPRSVTTSHAATVTTAATARGTGLASPAIPRWPGAGAQSRWPGHTGARWGTGTSDRWEIFR